MLCERAVPAEDLHFHVGAGLQPGNDLKKAVCAGNGLTVYLENDVKAPDVGLGCRGMTCFTMTPERTRRLRS